MRTVKAYGETNQEGEVIIKHRVSEYSNKK